MTGDNMLFRVFAHFLLLISFVLAGAPQARAEQKSSDAILILDASGSMWGQIGKDTKIIAAKSALGTIIEKWPEGSKLGLMAYGHRTKGDCKDIEMLMPLAAIDKEGLKAAANKLQPRGKTPISASIMQAAEAIRSNENGSTIVLVSDGIETCDADPCAVAAELKKADVKLVAHVIGFDIADPAAKTQLACIASETGGIYFDAKDASGLTRALETTVNAIEGEKVEAPPPPKPEPDNKTNVSGTLRLAEGSDPLTTEPFDWIFYDKGGTRRAFGKPAGMKTAIRPGDYNVAVWYNQVKLISTPMTVPAKGELTLDLVLNAGYVTSVGALSDGGKVDKARWNVRRVIDGRVEGGWFTYSDEPVPTFVLPAGEYEMALEKGAAATKKLFIVAVGDSINLDMSIDVGSATLTASLAEGMPAFEDYSTFDIKETDPTGEGNGKRIARGINPNPTLDVASGTYDLVVEHDDARRVFPIEIKSGENTKLNAALNAGRVSWKKGTAQSVSFSPTFKEKGQRRPFAYNAQTKESVVLPAGDYIAEVRFPNDANNQFVTGEFPVKVEVGKDTMVEFTPPP
jgi:Ca-activated chloride channel homolog